MNVLISPLTKARMVLKSPLVTSVVRSKSWICLAETTMMRGSLSSTSALVSRNAA
jgi:hypothetical protein